MKPRKRSTPSTHQRTSDRRTAVGGRRKIDGQPRTTFTKKVLVFAIAAVNFVYLVLEALVERCDTFL